MAHDKLSPHAASELTDAFLALVRRHGFDVANMIQGRCLRDALRLPLADIAETIAAASDQTQVVQLFQSEVDRRLSLACDMMRAAADLPTPLPPQRSS